MRPLLVIGTGRSSTLYRVRFYCHQISLLVELVILLSFFVRTLSELTKSEFCCIFEINTWQVFSFIVYCSVYCILFYWSCFSQCIRVVYCLLYKFFLRSLNRTHEVKIPKKLKVNVLTNFWKHESFKLFKDYSLKVGSLDFWLIYLLNFYCFLLSKFF